MKKIIFLLSLVSIVSALFVNIQAKAAHTDQTSNAGQTPATIKDPVLLAAWKYLDSQTEPIKLWDGRSLTGQQLAQHALDDRIVIVWDTKNICGGFSCAYRPDCTGAQLCQGKDYPIYMGLYLKEQAAKNIASLAAVVAHELFHHSQPFGWVADSQFEEYWAYYIQSVISNDSWKKEEQKDTLNPTCLRQWFVDHNMQHYLEHMAYPQSVSSLKEANTGACLPTFSK